MTGHTPRHKLVLAGALALPTLVACQDPEPVQTLTLACSADAPPTFLRTKIDDDNGDGVQFDVPDTFENLEDDDIADHAWIRDDTGLYHLFFQNEDLGSGSDIEHYTTADFRNLEYVGLALTTNPSGWDSHGLWAPHVIRQGVTYFMFYTGTTGRRFDDVQRIGVATSTDLTRWTRVASTDCADVDGDGCVYECDEAWTVWGDESGRHNHQCRDPFVVWDTANARWVLFVTAKSTNRFGVVAVAYSSDLLHWTGAGFIDATRRLEDGVGAQTTGGQAENPHVMAHDGVYYLLFTDWQDPEDDASMPAPRTMVQYATSSRLVADASGSAHWTYRGATPDPGVNAIEVLRVSPVLRLMTQSISNEASGDFEHRRELRLRCVEFDAPFSFSTRNVEFASTLGDATHPLAVGAHVSSESRPR